MDTRAQAASKLASKLLDMFSVKYEEARKDHITHSVFTVRRLTMTEALEFVDACIELGVKESKNTVANCSSRELLDELENRLY